MKRYLLIPLLMLFVSSIQAAPVTLDFTSGTYSRTHTTGYYDTYTEDGFTLTPLEEGNHFDSYIGAMTFHNGTDNVVDDNNLVLTYSGGAFDLTSIDSVAFEFGATSLDLLGSDSTTQSIGVSSHALSFLNVNSVIFSVAPPSGWSIAGWNSLEVNTTPVPVPAALWLFGSALIGLVGVRRKLSKASAITA